MGSIRAKIIDKNRYGKRYPLIRAPARTTYVGDADLAMEVGSIYFDNTDTGTLNYDAPFTDSNYQIVAIARQSGTESANVNIFVTDRNVNFVTVQASSNFTGYVDVLAVRIA